MLEVTWSRTEFGLVATKKEGCGHDFIVLIFSATEGFWKEIKHYTEASISHGVQFYQERERKFKGRPVTSF